MRRLLACWGYWSTTEGTSIFTWSPPVNRISYYFFGFYILAFSTRGFFWAVNRWPGFWWEVGCIFSDRIASSSLLLSAVTLSNLFTEEWLGDKFFEFALMYVFVSPRVSDITKLEVETWFKFYIFILPRPAPTCLSDSTSSFMGIKL